MRSIKNNSVRIAFSFFLSLVVWIGVGVAQAGSGGKGKGVSQQICPPGMICQDAGGGSGEVPTPFEVTNQKVELADGEVYMLVGWVTLVPASDGAEKWKPYLEIDLGTHPWLANEKRRANPFYPLEGGASYWKQFRGMKIRIVAEAHGVVIQNTLGNPEYLIQLKRIKEHAVVPMEGK